MSNMNELLPHPCQADMQRAVPADSVAGTSSYWVMPRNTAIWNFSIFRDTNNLFISRFRSWCSLWCSINSCGQISFIKLWIFIFISAHLSIKHHIFRTLLTLNNNRNQRQKRNIMKFYLLLPKHLVIQLLKLQMDILNSNTTFWHCKKIPITFEQGCTYS